MLKRISAGLSAVLCILLCGCSAEKSRDTQSDVLNIWCAADAPVAEALAALTDEYNALPGQTMTVSLKVLPTESAIGEAFNFIRPDLLVCTADRASSLELTGLLSSVPGLEETLKEKLNPGFDSVSRGSFIPLGGEAPLLLCAPGTELRADTFSELAEAANSAEGEFISLTHWSDIFASVCTDSEDSFSFELDKDSSDPRFIENYNILAELAYAGKLSFSGNPAELVAKGELHCAAVRSGEVRNLELTGCSVQAMPDIYDEKSQFISSVWGFAVTAGAGDSASPAVAFIQWLLHDTRAGDLALSGGLIPASACSRPSGTLPSALCDIYSTCRLYTVPEDSAYFRRRNDFDTELTAVMSRLY